MDKKEDEEKVFTLDFDSECWVWIKVYLDRLVTNNYCKYYTCFKHEAPPL